MPGNSDKTSSGKSMAKKLLLILSLVVALIFMTAFKGIYVNLQNAYSYRDLYNPAPDLLFAAVGSIMLGFVLGYVFKSKR